MAKKKKGGAKATPTRRTPRRGKQAPASEGEPSTAAETANSEVTNQEPPPESAPSDTPAPQTIPIPDEVPEQKSEILTTKSSQLPVVALHKKFGKYRCLFNSDESFTRKYEMGSDSETSSSVEVKVIDPCVSSESDSNMGVDTTSDTYSGACDSPMNHVSPAVSATQSISRDISPVTIQKELSPALEEGCPSPVLQIPFLCEKYEPVPPPVQRSQVEESSSEAVEPSLEATVTSQNVSEKETTQESHDIPMDEEQMYAGDDEEIITVVQIVEDDHDQYYDINIDSPKELSEQNTDYVNDLTQLNVIKSDLTASNENDIQKHFESLNLAPKQNFSNDSSDVIDITTPPCVTPDLQYVKDEIMLRPDPSITPSSTLSDDSSSSRVIEQGQACDSVESSPTGVRRSSRIKTISNMKQKTKGYGLVKTPLKKALITQTKMKLEELGSDSQEKPESVQSNAPNSPSFPVPSEMPVKVKSRWRRSSELEQVLSVNSPASSPLASPNLPKIRPVPETPESNEKYEVVPLTKEAYDKIIQDRMDQFQHLEENEYLCERMISKDTKKMICDCFMTKEELERGELACGEDCLNRLLMIECNSRCPVGDRCTNRRFQKQENADLKVFYADKKGCGIEVGTDIPSGEFLMEYVGEVLDYEQFYKRAQTYSDENNLHHYFMSLKGDTVIDATLKGNVSRFINHSCDPNAETQKWTVNGELRIGFFSKRDIKAGEELTFDYQFQRFGKVAQRCYCGADACRGWIGAEPDSDDDYEEEEEDVSTSKEVSAEALAEIAGAGDVPARAPPRSKRERKYKPKPVDLVQDADIEEDLDALSRTGVKNQSHTLRLSRTIVRAKTRRAQTALLRLLRDADLPCRRLFLDYRGLRLLAPWCNDAPLHFRWEMVQTVDRLPIPNKTLVHECRFFTIVERWLAATDLPAEPVYIDEATDSDDTKERLPVELPNRDVASSPEKSKDSAAVMEKVKDLCSQLLERWASLKEVFKIPKKERIQQMKEHERQANVERRAADSSGTRDRDRRDERDRDKDRERERDRERDRERERERDRERERERERDKDRDRHRERDKERERDRDRDDRDRRKRRSPESRRSIRLSERVLAAVPPMTKEERRRAFAEAAAAAEESRRREQHAWQHYWPQDQFPQMFPPSMMGPNNMPMMMPGNMPGGPMMPGQMPGQNLMPGQMQGPAMMPGQNMIPGQITGQNIMPGQMPGQNMMPGQMPGQNLMPGQMPGQNMMAGQMPGNMMLPPGMTPADLPPEWLAEFQGGPQFCPPFQQQQFCMTQPNMLGMGGYGVAGFMFGQQVPFHHPPADNVMQSLQPPATVPDPASVVLPSLWRSAVDPRGRTYYYHVKLRRPQWYPPPPPLGGDESSSEEEEEAASALDSPVVRVHPAKGKMVEGVNGIYEVIKEGPVNGLIPEHALLSMKPRKRRPGLVTERPISPRTEEDKLAGRLEVKRYKQTKEKLRRRKEKEKLLQKVRLLSATKGKVKLKPEEAKLVELIDTDSDSDDSDEGSPIASIPIIPAAVPTVPPVVLTVPAPAAIPEASPAPGDTTPMPEASPPPAPAVETSESVRRIKEQFRNNMARAMVQHLNPYRHSDAHAGRITCTADFKHLARKLTHFVMLKELKHCRSVEELVVTDSVRAKAKMFVRKYMAKFGPVYKRPPEEAD